jgi:AraC-like DNA-binding protein
MQDFASATMIRVIQAGAARLGLPAMGHHPHKEEHVPLQDKRALVGSALRAGGWSALLQLGQGARNLNNEPLIHLLVQMGQPWRVLDAWLRLERYLHSQHQITQTRVSDCEVRQHHAGRKEGVSPMVAESWLVLGVLAALLERSGCDDVQAHLDHGRPLLASGRVIASEAQLNAWSQAANAQSWQLKWRVAHHEKPGVVFSVTPATTLQEQLASWIHEKDNWQPDLGDVASAFSLSRRSLQRKLSEQGTRFVDVIGHCRAQRASHMLAHSSDALAEIGFASGYTDQAHFCRDFKRRTGLSPKSFRDTSLGVLQSAMIQGP